jgi:hypothetical protein
MDLDKDIMAGNAQDDDELMIDILVRTINDYQ